VEVSARSARPRLELAALLCVLAVLCAFLAGSLSVTASAFAAAQPPSQADEFSAADQYVESVPTAGGPKVPGVGKSRDSGKDATTTKLSPTVQASLDRQPAETAAQLERIATSPDYGAPAEKLRKVDIRAAHVPAAAVSAAGDGDDDTVTLLLIALLATTLLTVGTAAYRRYQSRKPAR
jgi:hypothetical protein